MLISNALPAISIQFAGKKICISWKGVFLVNLKENF